MSQLDALISRSQQPGRFVERRHFTLSREKAIEKQREFALRHPSQYVLELIQAAVFSNATYIAVDTRPSSLLVAWVGGDPIPREHLENILDYLFADRGDAKHRHLVQLAVAVNAILQRKPRVLRIESGDGNSSVRMEISANGDTDIGIVEDAIAGTYIYAEFSGGWFARFMGNSHTPERALVEEKCLYTPVPILLNGDAPFGYRGSKHVEIFGAQVQQTFQDDEGRHGVVAIHQSPRAPTGFRMVIGGVWISTNPLDELHRQERIVGVICDDNLRKTADHSDIVQDDRYVRMLHAVEPFSTKVLKSSHPGFISPKLPPIPEATTDISPGEPAVHPEPLPSPIPTIKPWAMVSDADGIRPQNATNTGPVFFVTPDQAEALANPDLLRFPYRVFILTEGQALTLSQTRDDLSLHRLTSKADLDFVRRILDRQERLQQLTIETDSWQLTVRRHLDGNLPDWAEGRQGIPVLVTNPRGAFEHGSFEPKGPDQWDLGDLSITVNRLDDWRPGQSKGINTQMWTTICQDIWKLALPEHGNPDGPYLARMLGVVAVPRFHSKDDTTHLAADLPLSWPNSLHHVPLISTREGPLSLNGFLQLQGTNAVRHTDERSVKCMSRLENRFGPGHLVSPHLAAKALLGVSLVGNRWLPLVSAEDWAHSRVNQVIWVGATMEPNTKDPHWVLVDQPIPSVAAAHLVGFAPEDWSGGWKALRSLLKQYVHGTHKSKVRGLAPTLPEQTIERMLRLALLHLADTTLPLLSPTDGGGQRSLEQVRSQKSSRVSASNGVQIAEPWTFAVTKDELRAVEREGERLQLRYDDDPNVWRSLADHKDEGWLLRQRINQSGVNGWLGLRTPFDPTAGVLQRIQGRLAALTSANTRVKHNLAWSAKALSPSQEALVQREAQRLNQQLGLRTPADPTAGFPQQSHGRQASLTSADTRANCHGLVWSANGQPLSPDQEALVQLEALRLYQQLAPIIKGPDKAAASAASLYGFVFARDHHHRTGKLTGTARNLARAIEVFDERGRPWGPLIDWLDKPESDRPPAPEGVPAITVHLAPETKSTSSDDSELSTRLKRALNLPTLGVSVALDTTISSICTVNDRRSHAESVVLSINPTRPLVKMALSGDKRCREILLLNLLSEALRHAREMGLPINTATSQQFLLAQRLT